MGWVIQGTLDKLRIEPGQPARYALMVGERALPLNELVGQGLCITFAGRVHCAACDAITPKSYGGGYCYDCFRTLARCDLCVMSPDRCHFHLGTCREPEWGEAFCMQPHIVYLANATGLKVGITRLERAMGRWLDQGAVQGLVICETSTRRNAGLIEAMLKARLSDRTDWRQLVSHDAPALDLLGAAVAARESYPDIPGQWVDRQPEHLSYPVQRYGLAEQLQLDAKQPSVFSRLLGCKGSYLLFEHGVFNVSAHAGFEVSVEVDDNPPPPPAADQLSLF